MKEYRILTSARKEDLQEQVNSLVKENFELLGPANIQNLPQYDTGPYRAVFYATMVREYIQTKRTGIPIPTFAPVTIDLGQHEVTIQNK